MSPPERERPPAQGAPLKSSGRDDGGAEQGNAGPSKAEGTPCVIDLPLGPVAGPMPHDRELRLLRGCRTALDELMHDIVLDDLPLSDFSKVYLYALDRLLADLEHDLPRRLAA